MWTTRQFPAVDTAAWVGDLDVVQALLERMPLISIFFGLVDGGKALGERVLVDIVLIVGFRIWIASHTLIIFTTRYILRAVCIMSCEHIVRSAVLFKIFQICLQLLISRLIRCGHRLAISSESIEDTFKFLVDFCTLNGHLLRTFFCDR